MQVFNEQYIFGQEFFPLSKEYIHLNVGEGKIGTYIIGMPHDRGIYKPVYVGRSDTDLRKRLEDHLGEYIYFSFKYFNTAKEAYEVEKAYYDRFKDQLDNKIEPAKPHSL